MIDFEKRIIKGKSGKIYNIVPEKLSVGRSAEFEIRSTLLGFNMDFQTIWKKLDEAKNTLKNATNFGAMIDGVYKIEEIQGNLKRWSDNQRPQIVEFCSLFCLMENEDVSVHDEEVIRQKYEDWAHIPHADFFFLCANVIPGYRDTFLNIAKAGSQLAD